MGVWAMCVLPPVRGEPGVAGSLVKDRLLCAYRPTVSVAARSLQKASIIRIGRGRFTVVTRQGLEASACGCYEMVRGEPPGCSAREYFQEVYARIQPDEPIWLVISRWRRKEWLITGSSFWMRMGGLLARSPRPSLLTRARWTPPWSHVTTPRQGPIWGPLCFLQSPTVTVRARR